MDSSSLSFFVEHFYWLALCGRKYQTKSHIVLSVENDFYLALLNILCHAAIHKCSARDWDGKDYLRIIPRVVW